MMRIDNRCSSVITFTQKNKVLCYSCNGVRLSEVGNSLWIWQKSHLLFIAQLKLDQKMICFSSCVNSVYVITLSAWGGRQMFCTEGFTYWKSLCSYFVDRDMFDWSSCPTFIQAGFSSTNNIFGICNCTLLIQQRGDGFTWIAGSGWLWLAQESEISFSAAEWIVCYCRLGLMIQHWSQPNSEVE